jgi:hypothetical protein
MARVPRAPAGPIGASMGIETPPTSIPPRPQELPPGVPWISKEVAAYSYARDPAISCATCTHFKPTSAGCAIVVGSIRGVDVSRFWSPKAGAPWDLDDGMPDIDEEHRAWADEEREERAEQRHWHQMRRAAGTHQRWPAPASRWPGQSGRRRSWYQPRPPSSRAYGQAQCWPTFVNYPG